TSELLDAWRNRGFGFGSTFRGGGQSGAAARPDTTRSGAAGSDTALDGSLGGALPRPALPDWLLRIDYVFHSRGLTTLSVKVMAWQAASDHRPVTALLAFTDRPEEPRVLQKSRTFQGP